MVNWKVKPAVDSTCNLYILTDVPVNFWHFNTSPVWNTIILLSSPLIVITFSETDFILAESLTTKLPLVALT
jgi:hypothetical protein